MIEFDGNQPSIFLSALDLLKFPSYLLSVRLIQATFFLPLQYATRNHTMIEDSRHDFLK